MKPRRGPPLPPPNQLAVVLQCVGSASAYELGVLKALLDGRSPATGYRALDPGIFSATGLGALNAAFLLSRPHRDLPRAARELQTVWRDQIATGGPFTGNGCYRIRGNPLPLLDPHARREPAARVALDLVGDYLALGSRGLETVVRFLGSKRPTLLQAIHLMNPAPLFSLDPLSRLAGRIIDSESLRSSDRRLQVVLSLWKQGITKAYSKEDLAGPRGPEIFSAACSLPGLFGAFEIEEELFTIGEDATIFPLREALEAGATQIHIIGGQSFQGFPGSSGSLEALSKSLLMSWSTPRLDQLDRLGAWNHLVDRRASTKVLEAASAFLAGPASFSGSRAFRPEAPRKVVVHRHEPRRALGFLSMLDFRHDTIGQLIAFGEQDAAAHDCAEAGCLVSRDDPGRAPRVDTSASRLEPRPGITGLR